jgi:hypothetical protein
MDEVLKRSALDLSLEIGGGLDVALRLARRIED